jgi:photosystem II stability/assembly factor-like uncharacterized protein
MQPQKNNWQKMPLLSPEMQKAGILPGGEGGQWYRDLVIAQSDPNFLLLGIDVGGIYRSQNGGKNWEQCTNGWDARGAISLAIDPRNTKHILGVAGNSLDWNPNWGSSPHGIYVSFNGADSWKQTLVRLEGDGSGVEGRGGMIAFDLASFNGNHCAIAYYVGKLPGVWKTEDAGLRWTKVNDNFSDVRVCVHTKTRAVFLAGKEGLAVSTDGGKSFAKTIADPISGLDIVGDRVFISGVFGIKLSRDAGKTFVDLNTKGIDTQNKPQNKPIEAIKVSLADAGRISVWVRGDNWQWRRYISHDGGKNWLVPKFDNRLAVLPNNVRQGHVAWHPSNPKIVFAYSGDNVYKSTDGGLNYAWSGNGYNGIMLGGYFQFSAHDLNTVFLAFQDYNGAFTNDGGITWNYRDISGKGWGGQCYGGHAVDKNVLFYGDAESWGGPRKLRLSDDGGKTWRFMKDNAGKEIVFAGADVSCSDPADPNILFASNWRSVDKGKTWELMSFCDGVFVATPTGILLGKKGNTIVRSRDKGATWETVVAMSNISDIAYDHQRKRIYVAAEDRLKYTNDSGNDGWVIVQTPTNQKGGHRVSTVAVDPINSDIVYAGSHTDIFACNNAVLVSTDGAKTWENLTTGNGPHEVSCIRVHPKTRQAWVAGSCYGMWKIDAPKTAPK